MAASGATALAALKIGGRVAFERLTRPKARRAEDVPCSPGAITPEWLTAVLCKEAPGAVVTDVVVKPASAGTHERHQLIVSYNDPGECAGLPRSMFTKSLPSVVTRMIGGFNVLGSLFFGWAGQRWNKLALLGGIYILRSLALAWYFMLPATPGSTLLFGAIMGFLWMGVGPLVAGAVAEMFGLRWQAMIQGLAFMSHQVGSFLGAYGGGVIYDSLGSYTMAWRIGVALGLAGGIIQLAFALIRPAQPPLLKAA